MVPTKEKNRVRTLNTYNSSGEQNSTLLPYHDEPANTQDLKNETHEEEFNLKIIQETR